jgi:hypothetical protein
MNPFLTILIELDTLIERKQSCTEDEEDALDDEIGQWILKLSKVITEE